MRQTLIVSTCGQITLPADIRKQFGIKSGEPVIIEYRNGEFVLKPATVLAVEMYSPEQVAEWDEQDQLSDAKRKAVLNRLPKRAPKVAKKRSRCAGFSTQTHCSPLRTTRKGVIQTVPNSG